MSRHGFMLGLGLITVGGKSKKKRPQGGGPEAASVREASTGTAHLSFA